MGNPFLIESRDSNNYKTQPVNVVQDCNEICVRHMKYSTHYGGTAGGKHSYHYAVKANTAFK
jgi:hypothetical protein